jgi:REP element-mobilizing transposase RayT
MRQPRILRRESVSTYHCYSRVVDRQMIFGDSEKQFFHRWMRRLEAFCGLRVLTYCLMSNHFHILVQVPCKADQSPLTESLLRERLTLLYSGKQLEFARRELDDAVIAAAAGSPSRLAEILTRYDARRFDLSSFLKDLKQRFSQWYNGRNHRSGHLWECSFKSVLVENGEEALLTMSAYIDLNPVRARLCNDPKDYRWSGYGEAVAGRGENLRLARKGFVEMLQSTRFGTNRRITWANAGPRYRMLLYEKGEQRTADSKTGASARRGMSRASVEDTLAHGGEVTLPEMLRCRVRHLCEGAVFGSREFVEKIFRDHRAQFDKRRKTGACPLDNADWGDLRVLRQPRQRSQRQTR